MIDDQDRDDDDHDPGAEGELGDREDDGDDAGGDRADAVDDRAPPPARAPLVVSQWRTMPACDSVNAVNTPIA